MNRVINKYLMLSAFGIIMVWKEAMVFVNREIKFDFKYILYLFVIYIFISSWTLILSCKNQFKAIIIMDLILSLIMFADVLYLRYYSQFLTIQLLPILKNNVSNLKDSVFSLVKLKDFLIFINFPLAIMVLVYIKNIHRKNKSYIILNILSVMIIAVIAFANINIRKDIKAEVLEYTYDLKSIADEFGLVYYHYKDISTAIINRNDKKNLTDERINEIKSFFSNTSEEDKNHKLRGSAKGKNLIMVQGEALQNFVVGLKVNGKEVTPNLNKLVKESLYFSEIYAQTAGGNTSDAEFMANNSLYPASAGAAYFTYPNNNYNALPNILKKEGYYSAAMHAFTNTFWNREIVYNKFGFDKFYYNNSYSTDKSIVWGINDKDFFVESIAHIRDTPKPFYSFMITVTTHYPFGYFSHENKIHTGDFEGTQIDDYIEDMVFLDDAIGMLIKKLKEEGLYDETMVVIYGDHRGLRDDKNKELSAFLEKEDNIITKYRHLSTIPLIMKLPNSSYSKEIKTPGGQIDILPTLMHLLGIENKYMMGKNLITTKDDLVIFRDGSFITENNLYNSEDDKAYDLNSGEEIQKDSLKPLFERTEKALKTSDDILKYDALPKLDK